MLTEQACTNTEPVSYRCRWVGCDHRLVREPGGTGYWWRCPDRGHGASHDPRRRGPRAWLNWFLGWAASQRTTHSNGGTDV